MEEKKEKKWEILKSEYVLNSPYYKVKKEEVLLPDGSIIKDYFMRERKGWVLVYCLTKEGKVILNRQYKHGAQEVVMELPGGMVEESESPEEGAKRELEEETGYVMEHVEYMGEFVTDPSNDRGKAWLCVGTGGKKIKEPKDDPSEPIEIELVSPEEALRRAAEGEIKTLPHVAAIWMGCKKLGLI